MRVRVIFTVKISVYKSLRQTVYGDFDREFDFDSHKWSCSKTIPYGDCDRDFDWHERGCSEAVVDGDFAFTP